MSYVKTLNFQVDKRVWQNFLVVQKYCFIKSQGQIAVKKMNEFLTCQKYIFLTVTI